MLKWRAFLILCFVLIFSGAARDFSAASPVYQTTFPVNSTADTGDANPGNGICDATGGGCTLRAAVEEANALAGNYTINLPVGNYPIGSPLNITENVTIVGTGDPVIDGQNGNRIFDLTGTVTFEIRDTILQNGNAGLSAGGAIRSTNPDSSVILQNVTIQNSIAAQGGAIFVFDGSLEITGSTITSNSVTGQGGAIVFQDDAATVGVVNVAISTTTISDNTADNAAGISITLENDSTGSFNGMQLQGNIAAGAQGGGVITNNSTTTVLYSNSIIEGNSAGTNIGGLLITNVDLENITIQANKATNRTGGLETAGTVQITGSTISGNTAEGTDPVDRGGGGIYNTGDLTITTTTIANNKATDGDGAGMYNQGGSFNITATTFSGNTATNGNGGGIYNPAGGANKVVINSTFSGNTVTGSGAGIYHADGGFLNLDSITVFGNTPGGGIFNAAGSIITLANSIVSQNGALRDCEGTGTYLGSNNLAGGGQCGAADDVTDLGPLADNGGPTRTHEPQANSNAIDAITPCAFPPTDQRGVPRPIPPAGACDIGAVEVLAGIDLSLTKTDTPDPVNAGAALAYTLTVENLATATSNATNITVEDTLSTQVTYAGTFTATNGGTCSHAGTNPGGTVTCTWAGPLAPGATPFSATIDVTVNATAPAGIITNTATVAAAENDPILANDTATQDTTVIPAAFADMSITKTDNPDPVLAGGTLDYTITVTNANTSTVNATTIQVRDTIPAQLTVVGATPSGTGTCNTAVNPIICDWAGPLAPGATESVVINTTVDGAAQGTITNNATVTAAENDPNPNDNAVAEDTLVNQPGTANLEITKTDSADPVIAGNALTYTLTVTNLATSAANATNVVVTDNLPAGVTFVDFAPPTLPCTPGAVTVTCTFANLAIGASETITINVTVDAATVGDITNIASVRADEPDPIAVNNTDTETTTVQQPVADVSVTKTDSADPVAPGSPLTYTLTVTNAATSTVPATNVVVTDNLPDEVTFVDFAPPTLPCTPGAGTVTCTFATLAIGASETITINVNVDPATNGTITNTATVRANETDPTPGNNLASENTQVFVPSADLQLTKTDNPDPVVAGGNLVYTITVQNLPTSTVAATNVQVTDTLPIGVTFVSVTPAGTTCSHNSGVVTCNFANIAVGVAETITLTVATTTAGTLSNTASVTTTAPDPDNTNNSDTEDTTVVDPTTTADISVTKQVDDPNTYEGDTITYTITVRNNGPAAATDLRLTDTFPAGLTYGTVTASPGTVYDTGTGVWNIGALPVNNTRTLTIQATVNAGTAGSDITNQIDVTSIGAGLSDPVPGNNTASVDVHVTRPLQVTKVGFDVNGGQLRVGDTVAWVVCALNPDTIPATNVIIRDTLDGNAFTSPTTLNVGTRATCPAALPVTGLTPIANLPAGNVNLVAPIPGAVNPGEVGVLYFETTVKDPGTSNRPNSLAYALTGGLALLGVFYIRKRKTAVLLLLILALLLVLPVSPTYAQEETSTEEADEPPPLPFMTPTVEEPPLDTATETPTASYTPSESPTATATVETATPIPGETLVPSSTPGITGTPVYAEPTPDAEGWMVYEMGDPRMTLTGLWEVMNAELVSGGNYLYTEEVGATLVADFAGESIRLDYLRSQNFGIFEVYIDEQLVATIDGYSEESSIATSEVIEVQPGLHRLRIVNTGLSNIDSEGTLLGLDTLELQGVLLEPIAATPTLPVVVESTPTDVPTATATLPAVEATATQEVIEPTATRDDTPIDETEPLEDGWRRYEMSHPDIQLLGNWDSVDSEFVSGGSYAYAQQADAAVELVFEGAAVRFDYLQYWNFGIFEVYIDGTLILSIDGYSPDSRLGTSAEFALEPGTHTLRIQNTGSANAVSEGVVIALDAIDVKNITAETPEATATPEPVEEGWTRYEMNEPSMEFEGEWQTIDSEFVSGGSYVYAEEEDATVSFEFTGDSVRVNYLKFYNFGIFEVLIDDEVVATIDAFNLESQGEATTNFDVEPGRHVIRIVNTGRSNAESAGIGVALDSIDIHEIELPTSTPTPEAVSITGKVWIDADRNGEISDGDKPADGLTLTLYADDGDVLFDAEADTLTSTLTVEDGSYEFAELTPGVYWLDAPDSNNPAWEALMVVAPAEVDILEPVQEIADGEGQISGRVFNDNNADREWSGAGESGIRHAEVLLYLDDGDEEFDPETDTLLDTVEVETDGSYAFDGLPVGVYWVWLDENTLPENYMDTVATGNHGIQNPKLLTITKETPEAAIVPFSEDELTRPENTDFAYALDTDGDTSPDSIEGSGDRDDDGIPNYLDAFDPSGVIYGVDAAGNSNALANVQVRLMWDNGGALTLADTVQPNPQTTSVNGGYRFDIVPGTANGLQATPRTFVLEILPLPSPLYTFPSVAFPPQGTTFDANPTAGSGRIVNFSNPPNAAQSHLFYMRFQIQQGDDPVVNNHIAVDVAPLPPADLSLTNRGSATRGDNPTVSESPLVTLILNTNLGMTFTPNNSSTRSAGATFTYTHTFTNTSTTQSDRVVFSLSQNTQTPAWTRQIRILRGTTLLATVNAGASSVPITVAAGESLTVEHVITIPIGTAHGTIDTSTITATSQENTQLSRTVTDVTTVESGCIQGTLFHDLNSNGVRDANETVFPNVRMLLTDSNNNPVGQPVTTDANGVYRFSGLPAGIYNVRIDATSIPGGVPVFLNPTTGTAQINVAIGGNCVTGNFSLALVDPAISKVGSVSQARPGETVTFTINLTNPSPTAITNVTVVDPLNGLLVFNSATSTQGTSTFNSTNNTVTFNLGTVAGNATVTMTVNVTISSLATPGTVINNAATLNYAEGPAETSPQATITIPSAATATPTATATTTGGSSGGTQNQAAQSSGGASGGTGGTGGGADTLPQTGYRPLPANTSLLFGFELDALSAMEITLMLLALVILLVCVVWAVAQWLAEHRSDKLARWLPNRPTPQLIRAVVVIAVVSSLVLSMVFATNLIQKPEQKRQEQQQTSQLPEVADVSEFADIEPQTALPIQWTEGGFEFAPPEIPASRIIIPRLGVDSSLVDAPMVGTTWDVSEIYDEVAHLDGTAYPGTMGNAVLAGHIQHQKGLGPFRNLNQLSKGDLIIAQGEDVEYTYIITDIMEVDPHAIEVTYPSNQPLLTLISCTKWDNETWSYKGRLVVRAQFKSWRHTDQEKAATGSWRRYEVDGRDIHLDEDNDWTKVDSLFTSGGSYVYSRDENAEITLNFTGEKVRIHYLYFWEFGKFDVYIDDEKVATIDAYNPMSLVGSSDIYFLEPGRHILKIVNTGERNESAKGTVIALDAIDVYRADEE